MNNKATTRSGLAALAKTLGVGEQNDPNAPLAWLGALGLAATFVVLVVMKSVWEQHPVGSHPDFAFNNVRFEDPAYWASEAAIAGQRLDVLVNTTAIFSALAILVVGFVLSRQFNWRMAALVIGPACFIGGLGAYDIAMSGSVSQFLMVYTPQHAADAHHLPPRAQQTLQGELLFAARIGLSAAFATAFAAIALSLRGGSDSLQAPVLRARWQSIFAIYVLAMIVVALMAADTRAIVDYVSAPLQSAAQNTAADQRGNLQRLGGMIAIYSGVSCALALVAACFPSFIAIRHDIDLSARDATKVDAGAGPEDWIKREDLDFTLLKGALGIFATLAPAFFPALANLIGLIHLPA